MGAVIRSHVAWFIALLISVIFVPSAATAQSGSQSTVQALQEIIQRSKLAIVKLVVEGRDPNGDTKKIQGSGFFVFSGQDMSILLTAAHVIGSNETVPSNNPDWLVENGVIVRKISLFGLDEKGSLVLRSNEVNPGPPFPGIDLVLLQINQSGYPSLPLAKSYADISGLHDIVLLAFEAEKSQLPIPPVTGIGQVSSPVTLKTTVPSQPGQSGGAWVDLKSGLVVGIARGANGGSFEATPVTAVHPFLTPFLPSSPPPVTVAYKICSGEYKGPCPSDALYQYCYFNVEEWAKGRCSNYKISRLATFGGNKCGYSVDEILCTPK
ncbi:serine protease [Bradyrhizobium sp. 26S5]|uniref:S1 family peptidase n=1 Tax=Bradyrhizobium sp. 26S5 TaxID=3139729 RepID=UPI0030D15374